MISAGIAGSWGVLAGGEWDRTASASTQDGGEWDSVVAGGEWDAPSQNRTTGGGDGGEWD